MSSFSVAFCAVERSLAPSDHALRRPRLASMATKDSDKLLAYGNVVFKQSDFALLSEANWLNDTCISLALEHLRHTTTSPSVSILDPTVAFMLSQLPTNAASMQLDSAGASKASLLLLAVNDNPDASVAHGGSHWSLLAMRRFFTHDSSSVATFEHYDSHSGSNSGAARRMASAIARALGLSPGSVHFHEAECPQQSNASDCGVFVVSYATALLRAFDSDDDELSMEQAMREEAEETTASMRRQKLRELVQQLRNR